MLFVMQSCGTVRLISSSNTDLIKKKKRKKKRKEKNRKRASGIEAGQTLEEGEKIE